MAELTIAVRFLHLAASMLPLGIFAFLCLIGGPAAKKAAAQAHFTGFEQSQWRILAWCLAVIFVSGVAGYTLQASVMTGRPLAQAITLDTLSAVLATQYGKGWLLRQAFLVALAGVVVQFMRPGQQTAILRDAGYGLTAGLVAGMALTGHAAAGEGAMLILQLGADALHLLAAGMWIGALVPLALLLDWCRRNDTAWAVVVAQEATRRFSWLGIATVTTLLMTGLFNAWQLVGDIAPLVGTAYGRLLLIKLGLLLPLLALAATNLLHIRPRLLAAAPRRGAAFKDLVARLQRNAIAEAGLGVAILVVVATLGVTAPARHVPPDWPFPFRLSWEINKKLPDKRALILLGAGIAGGALMPFGYAIMRRRYRGWALGLGLATLGGGAAVALPPLWVDAYPTTYRRPAVTYQAISVESGLQSYQQYCVACHGIAGFGDGPAGVELKPKPADLTAKHAGDHTAGDLFWWLTHGKQGTAMPSFKDSLNEEARWDLINFLRTLSAAEQARPMAPLLEPAWLVAPDFLFRTLSGENKSLKEHRGQNVVLLVLFTWPLSQARLTQLDALRDRLSAAEVKLLAVPWDATALDEKSRRALGALKLDLIMDGSQEAYTTYTLFRRSLSEAGTRPDPPIPQHMEFLIDRQGYVRARWIAAESRGWTNAEILLREIAQLNQEKPSVPAPDDHVH